MHLGEFGEKAKRECVGSKGADMMMYTRPKVPRQWSRDGTRAEMQPSSSGRARRCQGRSTLNKIVNPYETAWEITSTVGAFTWTKSLSFAALRGRRNSTHPHLIGGLAECRSRDNFLMENKENKERPSEANKVAERRKQLEEYLKAKAAKKYSWCWKNV